jgi:hypothetical protein
VDFFGYQIFDFPRFWDSDVLFWMAVGGVFVDIREAGCEWEGFFSQRNWKSPRILSWVLGLGF